MAVTFEGYERRINQIMPVLEKYGIKDLEEARKICQDKGFDPVEMVRAIQPICFDSWSSNCYKERMHKSSRCSKSNRRRTSIILYTRFCCR